MTPEERHRMDSLAIGIQQEKDYDKFVALALEITRLIDRKAHRFGYQLYGVHYQSTRPWRTVPAIVRRIVKPLHPDQTEKMEISIMDADELFREIRVDNTLTGIDGEPVALREGAHIDVTFEAETNDTVRKVTNPGAS